MTDDTGEKQRPSGGNSLQRYLISIRGFDLLSESGERRLATASRQGVEAARRELIQRNLRLVVKVARSYRSPTVGLDELIAEGNLGLIEAVRRFDPDRNVRFVSYAVWWIRKFMIAALHRGTLQATSPPPGEAPRNGEGGADGTARPRAARQRILSFEEFMQNSGDREFLEGQASDESPDPEVTTLEADLEEALAAVLHKLPALEREILELHFGIGSGPALTLHDIGERLGCTRERVRQLERRALNRARSLIESRYRA